MYNLRNSLLIPEQMVNPSFKGNVSNIFIEKINIRLG